MYFDPDDWAADIEVALDDAVWVAECETCEATGAVPAGPYLMAICPDCHARCYVPHVHD